MHDVLILGAGIHGLCAAFALRRRGRTVTVLDRFAVGHVHGGSHGMARITRSSYHERRYVDLAQRAHRDGWPLLAAELGSRLLHPTPGLFFGPPTGPFAHFLTATLRAGVAVERLDRSEAARAFPLLRFEPEDAVLLDHTAGVLAADRALTGLREWLRAHDVDVQHSLRARALRSSSEAVVVVTDAGELRARAVVVAIGAWLGELLPSWRERLVVLRQQVGYMEVQAPAAALEVPAFPVWCRIGETVHEFVYGLPQFAQPGLKIARHRTVGVGEDPDGEPPAIDEAWLQELARARLLAPVERLSGSEHCLYAVAPGEQLHVERCPQDARVVAVAACSGHGFKFGPVVGEWVADLVAPR